MRTQRVLSYGVLALPLSFAALPIYVHVPRFYEQVTGLNLALLGAILLAARLFDAFTDPWLGWLADRFSRPRMIAMALLPFTAGFVALMHPALGHPALWLLGSLALTYLGFSAASVAYQAHGAGLSGESRVRTQLTASREGFGLLGVLLAAALPALLASDLSVGTARLTWVLLALLLPAAAWFFLQGRAMVAVNGAPPPVSAAPMWPSLKRVMADGAFRRLLGVFLASGIAAALPATLFLFFVADVLKSEPASGPLLGLYFLAGASSLPGWVALAGRIGRVRAWLLAMGFSVVAFAGAGWLAGCGRHRVVCARLPAVGPGAGRRPGFPRCHGGRPGRTPTAQRCLFWRVEFCRQAQPRFGGGTGLAAACADGLRTRQRRGLARPAIRLRRVAPGVQNPGRGPVVALAA